MDLNILVQRDGKRTSRERSEQRGRDTTTEYGGCGGERAKQDYLSAMTRAGGEVASRSAIAGASRR